MGIEEVVTASRSPWQNAFVERVDPAARLPRPRHRVERARVAPSPPAVSRLLSSMAHSPLVGQGSAGPSSEPDAERWPDRRRPAPRRSAPPLRTSRHLTLAQRFDPVCRTECRPHRGLSSDRSMPRRPVNSWRRRTSKATRRGRTDTPIAALAMRMGFSVGAERPPGDAHRRAIQSSSDADGVSGRNRAKKGHKRRLVSEKCLRTGGSTWFHVDAD
jgi:hypothetical protein